MDIEIEKRFTSKSVTTALLIILTLTGTGMTALPHLLYTHPLLFTHSKKKLRLM